ncbi:MAG: glycosyltransferase family 39 protein [Actinobacteria bacterium]|nr:glycosyltransferase family 39 protein [Actinomycetota bacterium]
MGERTFLRRTLAGLYGRRYPVLLCLVFVLAVLLRCRYARWTHIYTYDSYYYLNLARGLMHGFSYSLRGMPHGKFLPLYPAAIGLASLIFPSYESAAKAVSIFFSSLVVFPACGIARLMLDRKAGVFAALFAAVEPISVTWSTIPMSEGLFVFLACTALYLFLRFWKRRFRGDARSLYGAAFVSGLAAMTRWEGLLAMAIFFLLVLYEVARRRMAWKTLLLMTLFFTLAYSPWLLRNIAVRGNPFPLDYLTEVSAHKETIAVPILWSRFKKYIFFTESVALYGTTHTYNYWLLLLGYGGMALTAWRRELRRYFPAVFLWWLLFGPLHCLFFYFSSRYVVGAAALMCVLAGVAFSALYGIIVSSFTRRALVAGATVFMISLLCMACVSSVPIIRDHFWRNILRLEDDCGGIALRELMFWVRDNLPEDTVLAAHAGQMASYYLGRDVLYIGDWSNFDPGDVDPEDPWPDVKEKGVDYFVLHATAPDLEEGLVLSEMPPELAAYMKIEKVTVMQPVLGVDDVNYAFLVSLHPPPGE